MSYMAMTRIFYYIVIVCIATVYSDEYSNIVTTTSFSLRIHNRLPIFYPPLYIEFQLRGIAYQTLGLLKLVSTCFIAKVCLVVAR